MLAEEVNKSLLGLTHRIIMPSVSETRGGEGGGRSFSGAGGRYSHNRAVFFFPRLHVWSLPLAADGSPCSYAQMPSAGCLAAVTASLYQSLGRKQTGPLLGSSVVTGSLRRSPGDTSPGPFLWSACETSPVAPCGPRQRESLF